MKKIVDDVVANGSECSIDEIAVREIFYFYPYAWRDEEITYRRRIIIRTMNR